MRHRVVGKRLGRDAAHRKALLRNLSDSLITHGSVTTTLAKAKYVRPYVEKLVTKAKKDSSFNGVKKVKAKLMTDAAIRKLFSDVAKVFADRNGGYTRIIKLPERVGDNAKMARIEFVEDVKAKPKKKKVTKETVEEKPKKETVKEKSKVKSKPKSKKKEKDE